MIGVKCGPNASGSPAVGSRLHQLLQSDSFAQHCYTSEMSIDLGKAVGHKSPSVPVRHSQLFDQTRQLTTECRSRGTSEISYSMLWVWVRRRTSILSPMVRFPRFILRNFIRPVTELGKVPELSYPEPLKRRVPDKNWAPLPTYPAVLPLKGQHALLKALLPSFTHIARIVQAITRTSHYLRLAVL
jgi:hypothetical protein